MSEIKDLNTHDTNYLNLDNLEQLNEGVISIYDGVMSDIKNCDAIFISMNTNLVILDGYSSINTTDLLEYVELKERVDANELVVDGGDCIVFNVVKDSQLGKRGISYVIAIITPNWEHGLNREKIVEQMDKGLSEAFLLSTYYDIHSIAISNIYPYLPTVLVLDMLSHYLINYVETFNELCVVRGLDNEGVYRINVLLSKLKNNYNDSLYVRLGGDVLNDYLTKMIMTD